MPEKEPKREFAIIPDPVVATLMDLSEVLGNSGLVVTFLLKDGHAFFLGCVDESQYKAD